MYLTPWVQILLLTYRQCLISLIPRSWTFLVNPPLRPWSSNCEGSWNLSKVGRLYYLRNFKICIFLVTGILGVQSKNICNWLSIECYNIVFMFVRNLPHNKILTKAKVVKFWAVKISRFYIDLLWGEPHGKIGRPWNIIHYFCAM